MEQEKILMGQRELKRWLWATIEREPKVTGVVPCKWR
jgi:hypothetical protein